VPQLGLSLSRQLTRTCSVAVRAAVRLLDLELDPSLRAAPRSVHGACAVQQGSRVIHCLGGGAAPRPVRGACAVQQGSTDLFRVGLTVSGWLLFGYLLAVARRLRLDPPLDLLDEPQLAVF